MIRHHERQSFIASRINTLFIPIALLLLLGACSPCKRLQQRDSALTASFEAIRAQYQGGGLSVEGYRFQLERLREKEEALFEDVKNCDIQDQQTYNYWHRSRMKFPSRIQQSLDMLDEEP